jgi:hypothetical protein
MPRPKGGQPGWPFAAAGMPAGSWPIAAQPGTLRPRAAPPVRDHPPDLSGAVPPPTRPEHGIDANRAASTQDLPPAGFITPSPDCPGS